ncbi:AtsE protein [Ameyamaea chiangmaiensis NBRC 103196]|uniref:Host attachment protein n=1 Tax=Ameyamaea chiangmaiensis TaxID=442969 RepID=A0A850PFT5_9PROT|nr:host attachment protein [Ameyamaea chiangmaiensis]MBS4074441.1 host attachment protein [Ameyamaea chiangmaiensis]NVN41096.1 host attachment protein [Ameyamaea chiangmaiensis]GBQ72051.1 AtsE protein [Ameyamaea chiangmaiensis NBRC 103196]
MATREPVLYVVADGEKARFLRFDGTGLRTTQSFGLKSPETNAEAEVGGIKAPRTDIHVQLKEHFTRDLAKAIDAAFAADSDLAGLVLSAPGHALHDIREEVSRSVTGMVLQTLDKDLVNTPDADLLAHFDRPATGWRLAG